MSDRQISVRRASQGGRGPRPVMLAIAGDSGTGKTTVTAGLVKALGPERITSVGADDYHCYDREERKGLLFTPLSPECNYIEIMEQHLQKLAAGEPILKPLYDHDTGKLGRPELVEPREFVIVEGLLPLHTNAARTCFEVSVYLDPPEALRIAWKLARDIKKRGYTEDPGRPDLAALVAQKDELVGELRQAKYVTSLRPTASTSSPARPASLTPTPSRSTGTPSGPLRTWWPPGLRPRCPICPGWPRPAT